MIDLRKCNMRINRKELAVGTKIEMEHTKNTKIAGTIARQHLCEFPRYYTKGLIPMEKRLSLMKGGIKKR